MYCTNFTLLYCTLLYAGNGVYSGVAPDAKIAFMDLSKSADEALSLPDTTTLYTTGYLAGARIHTNSWGSTFSNKGYYYGRAVDTYLYLHPVYHAKEIV